MTLSYDTARCTGYDNPVCKGCRRLEPGRPEYQAYLYIAEPVGECRYRIDSNENSWVSRPVSKDKGRHIGSSTADLHGVGES